MPNIDSSPLTLDQESEPRNTISESEYSEEESHSESNPESDPENLAEEFDLFLQLKPWTPLSLIPRTRNPFLMSHQQPSTSTVASTTTSAAPPKPQELKLGQPSTFDGNPKKARAWINNTQLYLLVNKDVYDHDDKKVTFALSFMKEGAAGLWALTETETAFTRNPPGFGTWANFLKRFNDSFILENTREQAIAWLTTTKVNNKIDILDYISKFKNNTTLSGITDQNILINFFSRGIPTQLMRRIYSMDNIPTTMEKWYQQTLHFKQVWERTNEITKGQSNMFIPFQDNRNNNHTQKKQDPNAMDIDTIRIKKLTPEERQRCFENNLCFKCCKPGHRSNQCQNPFLGKQKQPAATTAKIEEIPGNEEAATVGRISTMDF